MKEDIIPDWLNTDFFTLVLQQKEPLAEVMSYETSPAVSGGNNYCSRMWRVKVDYKDDVNGFNSISLMVKAPIPDCQRKELLDEAKFVEKEFQFYNELMPVIFRISENVNIIPKSFLSSVPNTIVLEDLKGKGYIMCDKLKQLDFDHSRILLTMLATYHALSVAAARENPELIGNIGKEHVFIIGNQSGDGFLRECLDGFSTAVKTWEGGERFEYLSGDKANLFFNRYAEIFTRKKFLNVLNHGDLWTNNILFKYNADGNVFDAKLVDFQLCKYASPGLDFNFFIWSSIQEDVRDNRMDQLKDIYLNTLNYKLEEFGCEERLSRNQLEEELEFTRIVGIFILFVMLPIILADPDDNVHLTLDDFGKDDSHSFNNMYNGRYYVSAALKILPQLEDIIHDVFCKNSD